MKTPILILLAIFAVFTTSCSKDDNNKSTDLAGNNPNRYTYDGTAYGIIDAEYYFSDDNTYLFFTGNGIANTVQIIFAQRTGVIPTGTYTYNNLSPGPSYDPQSNFWEGGVSTQINPLGYNLNGGTVTIANTPEGNQVTFNITTVEGTAQGIYNGILRLRN